MASARLLVTDGLAFEILRGTGLRSAAMARSTSREAYRAVSHVWNSLWQQFPSAVFTCGDEPIDWNTSIRKDLLETQIPSQEDMMTFKWAHAGILRGRLLACGKRFEGPGDTRICSVSDAETMPPKSDRLVWSSCTSHTSGTLRRSVSGGFEVADSFLPATMQEMPAMIEPRSGSAIAILAGEVHICGGWTNDMDGSSASEVWDSVSDTWVPLVHRSKVLCRVWTASGVIASQMYTSDACGPDDPPPLRVGGRHRSSCNHEDRRTLYPLTPSSLPKNRSGMKHCSCVVERFDTNAGQWQMLPALLESRSNAVAASLDGRLYVCGGVGNRGQTLRSAERWDPTTWRWERLPNMLTARSFGAARAVGGCLSVCGGIDESGKPITTTENFDPKSGTWMFAQTPPLPPQIVILAALTSPAVVTSSDAPC
eukprot:TRINITY_DN31899_c0_g1_i1.p1 TRINITY_DN31899_c0_g1~~TRINITY_DN31899_c0_g1_i1.p1  ORF type:complete len:425 (-),score=54.25 TRINITY_DN31899_c0_g1_i1:296-1570(-)